MLYRTSHSFAPLSRRVDTDMAAPLKGGFPSITDARDAARMVMDVVGKVTLENSGTYWDASLERGETLPW